MINIKNILQSSPNISKNFLVSIPLFLLLSGNITAQNKRINLEELQTKNTTKLNPKSNMALYIWYTKTDLNKTITFNPGNQLEKLRLKKMEKNNETPVARKYYEEKIKTIARNKFQSSSLNDLHNDVNKVINQVKTNIKRNIIKEIYDLSENELTLLKFLTNKIDADWLLAYSLTELMDTYDWEFNVKFMDCLLKNWGKKFVEHIPAIHDKYTSEWPYQFTQYAIYDKNWKDHRWASKANLALPKELQIKNSVIKLQGNDHHKAAFLFAINNIAELIKNLNNTQEKTLNKGIDSHTSDLIEYIATSHHAPKYAKQAAIKRVKWSMKKDYTTYCNPRIKWYGEKTENNYAAIKKSKKIRR